MTNQKKKKKHSSPLSSPFCPNKARGKRFILKTSTV